MAAVRMHFKKGEEGWDFGYLTVQLWLKTFMTWAFRDDKRSAMEFWGKYEMQGLLNQFQKGEVLFTIDQTVLFLQATNRLSAYLVSGVEKLPELLFKIVKEKTDRFKTLKEFEDFYLQWSSLCLNDVRDELDKEPRLRGGFNKLINA